MKEKKQKLNDYHSAINLIDPQTLGEKIIYWIVLNVGVLLISLGVYFFKNPNHFATGGVSGMAILLSKMDFIPITQAQWLTIINVALLILGFIFLGRECSLKTLYCTLAYSGETMLLEWLLPMEKIGYNGVTLTNQPMLEFVYATLLVALGSAVLFNCRASSGGTDILALILKKYTSLDVGKALFVTDALIAFSTFFVFGIEAGLYSVLGLASKSLVVDTIIEQFGKNKSITIITSHPEAVGDYILKTLRRSYTKHDAVGGYTGESKVILITVCNRYEAAQLKAFVKKTDPTSFVIITDTTEILGKGFHASV